MINNIEEKFVPDCSHNDERSLSRIRNKIVFDYRPKFINLAECVQSDDQQIHSEDIILGRLVFTRNGNFMFLQYSNQAEENDRKFVLVPCEISGKFNSTKMLKCCETNSCFVSCWLTIKNWSVIKVSFRDQKAPIRSTLLSKHLNPVYLRNSEIKNVTFLRKRLLCFSTLSISWVSPLYSVTTPVEVGIKGINLSGLVLHVSAVIRHRSPENQESFRIHRENDTEMEIDPGTEDPEMPVSNVNFLFGLDEYLRPAENSVSDSSFSITINSCSDGRDLVVFFPGMSLLLNRFALDWRHVYLFENLFPGSVRIHDSEGIQRTKECLIASNLTSIAVEIPIRKIERPVLEVPSLIQIDRTFGFGVFESNTGRVPMRIFLHNSNIHEISLGCSIVVGSEPPSNYIQTGALRVIHIY
ncbi:hypothetical protein HWI79_2404 [Cryptosporidium felis]|nr:hypothetical protein HWI79_2404 [Cryptosporidium felis]